jgi:hypothetical protein
MGQFGPWSIDSAASVFLAPSERSYTLESLPTVFRSGPYRLFFYSADHHEPPHVHVEREERQAKFWLDPVRLENSRSFRRIEIRQIERLVADNAGLLLEAWHEYFGN